MNNNETREREITLQEILWNVAFGWRRILICAVALAVVAGVLRYAVDMHQYKQAKKIENADVQEVEFTEEEKIAFEQACAVQNALQEGQAYFEASILMNLNPYEVNVCTLQYYVDSEYLLDYSEEEKQSNTAALVAAYSEYINNGNLAEEIIRTTGINTEIYYVRELITVEANDYPGIFTVELMHPDTNILMQMSKTVAEEIEGQKEEISKQIADHSLKLVAQNLAVRADLELASRQYENRDMLILLQTRLTSMEKGMTEEQLALFLNEGEEEEEEETTSNPTTPTINVKYILLGLIAGIFAGATWTICIGLFSKRLQSVKEISDVYNIRMLGKFQIPQKRNGLDQFLRRLKAGKERQVSNEEEWDIICSNIELYCKKEQIEQIYLIGTDMDQLDEQLIHPIMERLRKVGIEILVGGNICYDVAALRKMVELGHVILVEQVGRSSYLAVEKELQKIAEHQVNILGYFGVE